MRLHYQVGKTKPVPIEVEKDCLLKDIVFPEPDIDVNDDSISFYALPAGVQLKPESRIYDYDRVILIIK